MLNYQRVFQTKRAFTGFLLYTCFYMNVGGLRYVAPLSTKGSFEAFDLPDQKAQAWRSSSDLRRTCLARPRPRLWGPLLWLTFQSRVAKSRTSNDSESITCDMLNHVDHFAGAVLEADADLGNVCKCLVHPPPLQNQVSPVMDVGPGWHCEADLEGAAEAHGHPGGSLGWGDAGRLGQGACCHWRSLDSLDLGVTICSWPQYIGELQENCTNVTAFAHVCTKCAGQEFAWIFEAANFSFRTYQ